MFDPYTLIKNTFVYSNNFKTFMLTMTVFNKNTIEIGDCVIIRFGHDKLVPKIAEMNKTEQTRFGAVKHNDFIGKLYGSKITATRGFVHILPLTPEIWSTSLPHRTQIIYSHDASLIIGQMDLRPGSVVIEAGTGSAALTHHLARTVLPNGHVYTFEFHEERAKIAAKEFQAHQLTSVVTGHHRDVIGQGFPDNLCSRTADGLVLDLPQPWSMVAHATKVLKRGGRVCFFSPCIEQVQRTVEQLRAVQQEEGEFTEIETQTLVQRAYNVVKNALSKPNVGQEFRVPIQSDNCGSLDYQDCHKRHHTRFILEDENETRARFDAVPQATTAGHSGYLTFATWVY